MIPLQRAWVGAEELEEVRKVFETGWLGLGPVTARFEAAIGAYLPARNVVATSSGTAALHLAILALHLQPDDEVIVPSMTFAAAPQAILASGASVVFCEIEEESLNLDLRDVAGRLSARTRAIVPVHHTGLPCDMDGLRELSSNHGLRVVEDAAHAFGSSSRGRRIGSFGDVTCFSFDPIKNLTCGEGGAVVTNDDDLAAHVKRARLLGIDRQAYERKDVGSWYYEVVEEGFRYHLSDINAAIGLAQLVKLDRMIARRRAIVARYDAAFEGSPSVTLTARDAGTAPFSYVVRVEAARRDRLVSDMRREQVGAGVHYIPNHLQPFFRACPRVRDRQAALPVTERVWKEMITLPLHIEMSDADVDQVVETVTRLLR